MEIGNISNVSLFLAYWFYLVLSNMYVKILLLFHVWFNGMYARVLVVLSFPLSYLNLVPSLTNAFLTMKGKCFKPMTLIGKNQSCSSHMVFSDASDWYGIRHKIFCTKLSTIAETKNLQSTEIT